MLLRTCPPFLAVVIVIAAEARKGGQAVLQLHGSAAHRTYHESLSLFVSLSICTHAQAALWLLLARWLRSTHRCVTMAGAAAKESAERGVRWWVSRLERE